MLHDNRSLSCVPPSQNARDSVPHIAPSSPTDISGRVLYCFAVKWCRINSCFNNLFWTVLHTFTRKSEIFQPSYSPLLSRDELPRLVSSRLSKYCINDLQVELWSSDRARLALNMLTLGAFTVFSKMDPCGFHRTLTNYSVSDVKFSCSVSKDREKPTSCYCY